VVFHFNKKHLEDETIPMWVLKCKGETYYVHHVTCNLPWSTKETPDNSHTKGSIKIKQCLVVIDEENCATISELTPEDASRLRDKGKITRIITQSGENLRRFLDGKKHGPIKMFGGACSRTWYVATLYSENMLMLLQLAINDVRVLMPNEDYYKLYDKFVDREYIDEDDWYDDDDDDLYEN
jgi:hypothetical protein